MQKSILWICLLHTLKASYSISYGLVNFLGYTLWSTSEWDRLQHNVKCDGELKIFLLVLKRMWLKHLKKDAVGFQELKFWLAIEKTQQPHLGGAIAHKTPASLTLSDSPPAVVVHAEHSHKQGNSGSRSPGLRKTLSLQDGMQFCSRKYVSMCIRWSTGMSAPHNYEILGRCTYSISFNYFMEHVIFMYWKWSKSTQSDCLNNLIIHFQTLKDFFTCL